MSEQVFDPCQAVGVIFGDHRLARCVRMTAIADPRRILSLGCYQSGIRHLEGIEELTNLEKLDLHFNEISDGRPLTRLKHLKELHLGLNACSDIRFLAKMPQLEHLTLFDNEIEDATPLAGLRNLQTLHLRFNNIDDLMPLKDLTNVTEASISSNVIEDIRPLKGWKKIEVFNMYKNFVTDISVMRHMPNLREVYIGDNPIRDLSPLFDHKQLIEAKTEGLPAPQEHKDHLKKVVAYNRYQMGLPVE